MAKYTVVQLPYKIINDESMAVRIQKNFDEVEAQLNQLQVYENNVGTVVNDTVTSGTISKTSATVIVADGSTTTNTNRADYVVPSGSVNAEVTIQQAIDALGSSGGKVALLEGTYNLSNKILINKPITLEGQGDCTIITGVASVLATEAYVYVTDTANVVLSNFKITTSSGLKCRAVHLDNVTESKVTGLTITNCTGISFGTGSKGNLISGNSLTNCLDNAIYSDKQLGTNTISNNIIDTVTADVTTDPYGCAIYFKSIKDSVISNNSIQNVKTAVSMQYSHSNTLTANTIITATTTGIYLASSNYNSVTANIIQNSTDVGIDISGISNTLTGNSFNSCGNSAIRISGNYNNIQGNVIRKGASTTQNYAVTITGQSNVVTNNDMYAGYIVGGLYDLGTGTITTAGNRT